MDNEVKFDMPMPEAVLTEYLRQLLNGVTRVHLIDTPTPGMSLEDTRTTAADDITRCIELIQRRKILTLAPDKDGVKFGIGGYTPEERQVIVDEINEIFRDEGILMGIFKEVVRGLGLPLPGIGALPPPPPAPAVEDTTAVEDAPTEHTVAPLHLWKNGFDQPATQQQLKILFENATPEEYEYHLRKVAHTRPLSDNPELRPGMYAGYNLTSMQQRVLEAVVSLFSDTQYRGHYNIPRGEYLKTLEAWDEGHIHPVNQVLAYANNKSIPIIRTTYGELLDKLGYGAHERTQSQAQRVKEALTQLASQQYHLVYRRLDYDEKGRPRKDSNGDYIMGTADEITTLIRLVRFKPDDKAPYIEIHPSAAMIDQVNSLHGGNYFLLIPKQWRIDLQKVIKRAPSIYEERFLMWCRVEFEQMRRKKRTKAYTITITWDELAQRLWMPDSLRKANKRRARAVIEQAYATAIKAGYLERVDNTSAGTVLHFNAEFYPGVEERTDVEDAAPVVKKRANG